MSAISAADEIISGRKGKRNDTQIHKYKYTNTQIQIHKCLTSKYRNKNTQIQLRSFQEGEEECLRVETREGKEGRCQEKEIKERKANKGNQAKEIEQSKRSKGYQAKGLKERKSGKGYQQRKSNKGLPSLENQRKEFKRQKYIKERNQSERGNIS